MKTIGRGRDYQKALVNNLITNLFRFHRITTTRARAKLLQKIAEKRIGSTVRLTNAGNRRGDSAPQIIVELVNKLVTKKEDVRENETNTGKRNSKKVAPR